MQAFAQTRPDCFKRGVNVPRVMQFRTKREGICRCRSNAPTLDIGRFFGVTRPNAFGERLVNAWGDYWLRANEPVVSLLTSTNWPLDIQTSKRPNLFISERHHRIGSSCPTRRKIARQTAHREEYGRSPCDGRGISRIQAK